MTGPHFSSCKISCKISCKPIDTSKIPKTRRSPLKAVAAVGLGAVALCGLSLALAGCQDMVTFAGDSRQEGIKQYNAGNYADAAGAFNNAVRQDPRDYQSYYYLGRSYESLKQHHQAVQAYRTALDVMANSMAGKEDQAFRQKVLDGLAVAAAAGNSRELEQAAIQNRQQPTAEDDFVLAKVHRIHGDADSALEAYNAAALKDPNNFYIAKEFGMYLIQLNQGRQAAPQLTRAYVLNRRANRPEDPQVTAALRQVGVVPGPGLVEEADLVQPPIPHGPLPEVDLSKLAPESSSAGATAPRE